MGVRRCAFNTLGKSNPAHGAGAPAAQGQWVAPARWVTLQYGLRLCMVGRGKSPSSLFTNVFSWHKCTGNLDSGLKPVVTIMIRMHRTDQMVQMKYNSIAVVLF